VAALAVNGANGEGEPRAFLSQELGSASVEGHGGSGEADSSTDLLEGETQSELADREEEEGCIEEEEEEDHDNVGPQSRKAGKERRVD
jgi:hypothetical protein